MDDEQESDRQIALWVSIEETSKIPPLYVHRPLHTNPRLLLSQSTFSIPNTRSWSMIPRLWTIGFKLSKLERLFDSVPDDVGFLLQSILSALHSTQVGKASAMPSIPPPPSNTEDQIQEEIWETDDACGYLKISYDPATQLRSQISMNSTLGRLRNMHREELLARYGSHEVDLPSADLDFFLLLIDDFLNPAQEKTRYIRLVTFGAEGQIRALLVCNAISRSSNCVGQALHDKFAWHPITPEEYDAATLHTPWLCPLYRLGDRRSGHQLLLDCPTDLAIPFPTALQACRSTIVAVLAAKCQDLHAKLGPHRSNPRDTAEDWRQLPLQDKDVLHIPDSQDLPAAVAMAAGQADAAADWRLLPPLARYWEMGVCGTELDALLRGLTPRMAALMRRTLAAIESLAATRRHHLAAAAAALCSAAEAASAPPPWAGNTGGGNCELVCSVWGEVAARGGGDGCEMNPAELWEDETEMAFITFTFDGSSGRRTAAAINRRHAEALFGEPRDAALRRIDLGQAPLGLLETDWLADTLAELQAAEQTFRTAFLRVAMPAAPAGAGAAECEKILRGVLVRRERAQFFDGAGRVVRVSFLTREISADEYDAAVVASPHLCPLFLAGDLRSGRQLLDDFRADSRRTLGRLARNRRSQPEIRRLDIALCDLCEHVERAATTTAATTAAAATATTTTTVATPAPAPSASDNYAVMLQRGLPPEASGTTEVWSGVGGLGGASALGLPPCMRSPDGAVRGSAAAAGQRGAYAQALMAGGGGGC